MLDCCLWDLVDCMRHEGEKFAGNTRDRGEKQGELADLPKKPKSPLQHYRLLRKGKDVLA